MTYSLWAYKFASNLLTDDVAQLEKHHTSDTHFRLRASQILPTWVHFCRRFSKDSSSRPISQFGKSTHGSLSNACTLSNLRFAEHCVLSANLPEAGDAPIVPSSGGSGKHGFPEAAWSCHPANPSYPRIRDSGGPRRRAKILPYLHVTAVSRGVLPKIKTSGGVPHLRQVKLPRASEIRIIFDG
jgi:hypothetical protein